MRSQETKLLSLKRVVSYSAEQVSFATGERELLVWPYELDSLWFEEIHSHIHDAEWQRLRLAMKGVSTGRKLAMCQDYLCGHIVRLGGANDFIDSDVLTPEEMHHRCVVVINYINALKRGGQLDSLTLKVRR